jgi:hypothetical protein
MLQTYDDSIFTWFYDSDFFQLYSQEHKNMKI